jgi:hypothetical protein
MGVLALAVMVNSNGVTYPCEQARMEAIQTTAAAKS